MWINVISLLYNHSLISLTGLILKRSHNLAITSNYLPPPRSRLIQCAAFGPNSLWGSMFRKRPQRSPVWLPGVEKRELNLDCSCLFGTSGNFCPGLYLLLPLATHTSNIRCLFKKESIIMPDSCTSIHIYTYLVHKLWLIFRDYSGEAKKI